ncbi:MAG: ribonuclease E/G [Lachnospiraceae bacterium]|nr:ribonuclease E/G [Lachnospiraceae bacterium]
MSDEMQKKKAGSLLFLQKQNKIFSVLFHDSQPVRFDVFDENSSELGGIYVGKIKSVVRGMNAAFVEYRPKSICFLPFSHLDERCLLTKRAGKTPSEGDEVLIQITGEAVKTKEPEATALLSLSGKYAVLSIRRPGIFFSKKFTPSVLKRFDALRMDPKVQEVSKQYGIVIRSNAATADLIDIQAEIDVLYEKMEHIFAIAAHRTCYSELLLPEPSFLNVLDDYPDALYDRIVTDIPSIHERICDKIKNANGITKQVSLYADESISLWNLYSMQKYLDLLKGKKVYLPSGGYLVIEHTEALTAIDVNSGKADMGKERESAYLKINLEAAKEIASQMILRNLSGMILVDFINLRAETDVRTLMDHLTDLLKNDPVPASVIDMTALGLVEITRKKKRRPLYELLCDFL